MSYGTDNRTASEKLRWQCQSCDKDTFIDNRDYYMLTDKVWESIATDVEGMMCMDCVEAKLGHPLTAQEIMVCPLNTMFNNYTRNILISSIAKLNPEWL